MTHRDVCKYCAHWDAMTEATGYCRRSSPMLRDDGQYPWPATNADDWCGEFRQRAKLTEQERHAMNLEWSDAKRSAFDIITQWQPSRPRADIYREVANMTDATAAKVIDIYGSGEADKPQQRTSITNLADNT